MPSKRTRALSTGRVIPGRNAKEHTENAAWRSKMDALLADYQELEAKHKLGEEEIARLQRENEELRSETRKST